MKKAFPLSAALLLFASGPAAAAVIVIDPANVSTSSEIPPNGGTFDRINDYIVDGSGLSAGAHNNGANGVAWLSSGNGASYGGIDPDPWVIFDLGATYTINSFQVWNYNEGAGTGEQRGVNRVEVEYGNTLIGGDTMGGDSGTVSGITNFAMATGNNGYTGEVFNTFTTFNARYIKFDINSNHEDSNSFYGLSEVQFDGVLVPEPSALLISLSGCLLLLRRRRC